MSKVCEGLCYLYIYIYIYIYIDNKGPRIIYCVNIEFCQRGTHSM